MLKIVTDGAVDLPPGWQEEYDIQVLPLRVRFGETTYLQGIDLDEEGFYRLVRETRTVPKTSLPSPGEIQAFYHKVAAPGDQIISIHVANNFSGTYATVQKAAEEVRGELNVYPVDSGSASMAMGFMAREARLMERSGAALHKILKRLEQMRLEQTVIFTLDTLDFAQLNGRVSAIQALFGSALKVKPILLLRGGLLEMAEKVRTRKRSLDRVLEYVKSKVGDSRVYLAVIHAADLESGREMLRRARECFNCAEPVLTSLSVPVAANLGPGAIGIIAMPANEEEFSA